MACRATPKGAGGTAGASSGSRWTPYLQRTAVQGDPDLLAGLIPGGTQDPEGER